MKKALLSLFILGTVVAAGFNQEYSLDISSTNYSDIDQDQLFNQYCGDVPRISTKIPRPNYQDPLVLAAVHNLNTVAPVSFYMYSAVIKSYGFRNTGVDENGNTVYFTDDSFPMETYLSEIISGGNTNFAQIKNWDTGGQEFSEEKLKHNFNYEYRSESNPAPQDVKGNTHAFLTYLCGEFRDRPSLIQEKLTWIKNMIKLPAIAQEPIVPSPDLKNVWSQLTAESYAHYVTFSRQAFNAKEAKAWENGRTFPLSAKWNVDKPVPAFTVCEVKYMLTEYISQPSVAQKTFPGLETYLSGLETYQIEYCSQEDKDYYYDFRGDSNMKPNSPESNGMIWHATSMMSRCQRDAGGHVSVKSTKNDNGEWVEMDFPQEECVNYMSRPFSSRWNAARAALATWTLRNEKYDPQFANTAHLVSIVPTYNSAFQPASFKFFDSEIFRGSDLKNFMNSFASNFSSYWLQNDIGYTKTFTIDEGINNEQIDYAYERIKGAVDRHTDWYASGYDDSSFEPQRARVINQAYSPFVASSYEMSESDAFTAPGITVDGPRDGRRQWMYVFKVHKDQWYNTSDLASGKKINFETQWLDETSFGTTQLADTERAWDRLGTPLEGEMESILYLHNVLNEKRAIKYMHDISEYPAIVDDHLGATKN